MGGLPQRFLFETEEDKIILVTPNEKKYEGKYIKSGIDNYIIKPVTKLEINNILNEYLKNKISNKK